MSTESDEDIYQEGLVKEDAARGEEEEESHDQESEEGESEDEDKGEEGEKTKEEEGNGQGDVEVGEENYGEWNDWSSCDNQIYKFR